MTYNNICSDKGSCLNWLDDVLKCEKEVEKNIALMLSAILQYHHRCEDVFDKCLECIYHVCKVQPILVSIRFTRGASRSVAEFC